MMHGRKKNQIEPNSVKNKDTIKCSNMLQVRQWSVETRRSLQLSDNDSRL